MRRTYFPGLNTLRAFAALSVISAHLMGSFAHLRDQTTWTFPRAFTLEGHTSVNLFFVLSGFLIAYLLFQERAQTGDVDVKAFYVRRVLRIWPLYYLLVLVGFGLLPLVFPDATVTPVEAGLTIGLLANVALAFFQMGALRHLWSISIEEQFYLVLPLLARRKHYIMPLAALLVIVLRLIGQPIANAAGHEAIVSLYEGWRFECMAVGVLMAYLYHTRPDLARVFYHRAVQVSVWVTVLIILMFWEPNAEAYFNVLMSVLFAIIILNVATNPRTIVRLRLPALEALGRISYGLYMYHYPVLFVMLHLLRPVAGATYDVLLWTSVYALTIGIAWVSYRYLEQPFLRLKDRWQPRPSTQAQTDLVSA